MRSLGKNYTAVAIRMESQATSHTPAPPAGRKATGIVTRDAAQDHSVKVSKRCNAAQHGKAGASQHVIIYI